MPTEEEALIAQSAADEAAAAKAAGLASDDDGDDGEDKVTLTKAEHDALQAAARLHKKQERERKQAEAAEKAALAEKQKAKAQKAADEAGLGLELREARAEAAAAKAQMQAMRSQQAVDLAIRERGWNDEAKDLAIGQLDLAGLETGDDGLPTSDAIDEALDSLTQRYPNTFNAAAQSRSGSKEPDGMGTRRAPANPTWNEGRSGERKFEGYVTPDEFMRMSQEERQIPETWARIEKSMPHWDVVTKPFNHKLLG